MSACFDEAYVRRLREGDPAVELHFTSYFGQLIQIKLRSRLVSSRWIDDVRQETFLRVLRTLRSGEGLHSPDRLPAYVHSVCSHVLAEYLRTEERLVPMDEASESAVDHDGLDTGLVNLDRKRLVESVLAELSPTDREALKLVFLEELDKVEVCRRLGITPEYLRVVLHRAKARFRQKLAEETDDHQPAD